MSPTLSSRLQLSVSRRLALGYAALLGALLLVGAVGLQALSAARDDAERQEARHFARLAGVHELQGSVDRIGLHARGVVLAEAPLVLAQELRLLNQQLARHEEVDRRLHALDWTPEGLKQLNAASTAAATARPRLEALLQQARGGRDATARPVRDASAAPRVAAAGAQDALVQLRPAEAHWQQQVHLLAERVADEAQAAAAGARAEREQASRQLALLLLACLGVGAVLSWALVRSVRQPVKQAVRLAERLAAESSGSVSASHDELARLQHAMRGLQQRLRRSGATPSDPEAQAAALRAAAVDLTRPSAEASAATASLSSATVTPLPPAAAGSRAEPSFDERPAAAPVAAAPLPIDALQAAAVAALEGTPGELPELAERAPGTAIDPLALVDDAVQVAERGSAVVTQVVSNMEEISASSRRINEILATIDSIAFQTNLLALNAAVQAARAGQDGRHQGVQVAGEVRGLAQRAASAAREIKGLIHASVEKAESGTRLVRDAGATMDALVSSVQSVTELVGRLSHPAQGETPQDLDQADRSVRHLDLLTRRNAALVEQSASAADALRDQADRLQKVVAAFRLLQQTQEAAWTAHTAIRSARSSSRGDTQPGGLDPLGAPGTPRRPGGAAGKPADGPDWEKF